MLTIWSENNTIMLQERLGTCLSELHVSFIISVVLSVFNGALASAGGVTRANNFIHRKRRRFQLHLIVAVRQKGTRLDSKNRKLFV